MVQNVWTRRKLLKRSGETAFNAALIGAVGAPLLKANVPSPVTPPQTEGPFYPVKDQLDKNADMTFLDGHDEEATGERIFLDGKVINSMTSEPIEGALVEFWQACASGRYQHPDDPNPAPLDPHFQYWAQVRTDSEGSFSIKTIVPGSYPANEEWLRPPHIHVKVHANGFPSLTTQLYFEGHPLNLRDHILKRIPDHKKKLVTVRFVEGKLQKPWEIFLLPRSHLGLENLNNHENFLLTPEL